MLSFAAVLQLQRKRRAISVELGLWSGRSERTSARARALEPNLVEFIQKVEPKMERAHDIRRTSDRVIMRSCAFVLCLWLFVEFGRRITIVFSDGVELPSPSANCESRSCVLYVEAQAMFSYK